MPATSSSRAKSEGKAMKKVKKDTGMVKKKQDIDKSKTKESDTWSFVKYHMRRSGMKAYVVCYLLLYHPDFATFYHIMNFSSSSSSNYRIIKSSEYSIRFNIHVKMLYCYRLLHIIILIVLSLYFLHYRSCLSFFHEKCAKAI